MFQKLFARSGLSLDRLRSFLEVAETGAIARAAPSDPVRQSQLSRQISELEEFFGTALVERRGRGLALTAAGSHLAVVIRESLQGLSDVAAVAESTLSVALGTGDHLLHAHVIPHAHRLPPVVTLTLASMQGSETVSRLLDARLDLGIVRTDDIPTGLRTRALGTIRYALYVPRLVRPKSKTLPLTELLTRVPIAAQYGDAELATAFDQVMQKAGATPALVCETLPQAQRAVATKRFAAVLPTLARSELPARDFDEIPVLAKSAMNVVLAWHPRLERQRPAVFALVPQFVEVWTLPG
jgi:DNA-binding transcriptional LysR family regulator